MSASILAFQTALDRVPRVLLDSEDARVLEDARTSASVVDSLTSTPVSVVLVGGTGVGKSHILNGLVGFEASIEGAIRPTTRSIVIAGSSGPTSVRHAYEYVYAADIPTGVAVVDTPAQETDNDAVMSAIDQADIAILVVSPSRYADATTVTMWDSLAKVSRRMVVMNRLRGSDADRTAIMSSAEDLFDRTDILTIDESGPIEHIRDAIAGSASAAPRDDKRIAIARGAAVQAGLHLVQTLTHAAIDLGHVEGALDTDELPRLPGAGLTVGESWLITERGLVEAARRLVDAFDDSVLTAADGDVARRMLTELGPWQAYELETLLTRWRDRTGERFRTEASNRWRRQSTERLIDQTAWKVGVNPNVAVPTRVRRAMKRSLGNATAEAHHELLTIIDGAVERRLESWRAATTEAGSFRPGELLAAVEGLRDQ